MIKPLLKVLGNMQLKLLKKNMTTLIIGIQPTSPIRDHFDFDRAVTKFKRIIMIVYFLQIIYMIIIHGKLKVKI